MDKQSKTLFKEEWKDIKGYEGLYQVSNLGRVKSLKFKGKNRELILSQGKQSNGYLFVSLVKNKKIKTKRVHRLVAEAFITNINNYPSVNHINENKEDNSVCNLEWCSVYYNNTYGTKLDKRRKKVLCVDTGKIFNSVKICAEEIGVCSSYIVKCCKGKRKAAKGMKFRYAK
jgi:hypothetical protein